MTFLKAHGRFILSACLALALGGLLVNEALWQRVLGSVPVPLETSCVCPAPLRIMTHAMHPQTLFCEDEITERVLFYWDIGAASCVPVQTLTDINHMRDVLFQRDATVLIGEVTASATGRPFPFDVSRTWVLPDLSGHYYGSPIPLQPGDCLRVTASRTLEKVDACQRQDGP
jgi:hypothetical protein